MNAVVFYAVVMFQGDNDSESTLLDSNQSAVLIGLTRFIMTAATCIMLAHVGRRPLSIVSGIGMAAAMLTLSTSIYVQQSPSPALALPCLAAFIAANTVGFFAVPWVMLGELLPEKCRGFASGLVSAIVYMFIFVIVKFFPYLLSELGQAGVFGLYGTISLIGFIFVIFFLPETHEKTLEEIEKMFQS
jgi:Na+/melibiose symporter-like transporter